MNFYKHFIGDYARDTGDLSMVEHGAYRLMLDHFYGTSRPLPENKKALYRLLRAESDTERKAVDAISLRFWRNLPSDLPALYSLLDLRTEAEQLPLRMVATEWTEAGGLINLRALGEIVKAQVIAEKNRQTAMLREQKKRLQLVSGGHS
jgi:hypothetical protein